MTRETPRSYANLSRFHPDYGMSPQEHENRKKLRAQGKLKFTDKEANRQAFYGLQKKRGRRG